MMGSSRIDLPVRLSEQAHGLILHWQGYNGTSAQNGNHSYQVVPREHAAFGGGVLHLMGTTSSLCRKYLYVTDTEIKGHDDNGKGDITDSGATFNNDDWVLTQVIAF